MSRTCPGHAQDSERTCPGHAELAKSDTKGDPSPSVPCTAMVKYPKLAAFVGMDLQLDREAPHRCDMGPAWDRHTRA